MELQQLEDSLVLPWQLERLELEPLLELAPPIVLAVEPSWPEPMLDGQVAKIRKGVTPTCC